MIHLRLNNLNFPAENETQNHRKSRIQRFERSELRLHFEWPKLKNQKWSIWRVFENQQCYQTGQF